MRRLLVLVLLALFIRAESACDAAPATQPGVAMEYGPFLTSSLDRDPAISRKESGGSTEQTGKDANHLASKSVNVRLGEGDVVAGVSFDTDLLRYTGGWDGGFLNLRNTHLTTEKGSVPPSPAGSPVFVTPRGLPGWWVG